MKKEVYILIDAHGNYVGIHTYKGSAEHHKFHREAKLKNMKHTIRKATLEFQ